MKRRHALTSILVSALVVTAWLALCPAQSEAGFQWATPYVSAVAGYDSNVRRISSTSPPAGQEVEGDGRAVFLASLGANYDGGGRLRAALEARPYYVKYFNINEFDRADVFAAGELFYGMSDRWKLEVLDRFRYTYFTGRDFDRLYNSLEPAVVWDLSRRWEAAAQYRYMYRDNPRRILDWWQAHGAGGWVGVDATDRLSLKAFGRVDFQSQQFVFPRGNEGERYWADLSGRYFLGSKTLLMGKYLFQKDDMAVAFAPGPDYDVLGDPADDFADGILQSLRFMEDADNNYRKHLLVLLSHTSIHEGTFLEAFLLYQDKLFDQTVIQLPDRPRRHDRTYVAQVYILSPLGRGFSLLGTVRYEQNDSNDARRDFHYTIVGAGLKWSF
jgi:hypothetical protein